MIIYFFTSFYCYKKHVLIFLRIVASFQLNKYTIIINTCISQLSCHHRKYFLTVLEAESLRLECPHGQVLWKPLSGLQAGRLLTVPSQGRERALLSHPLLRAQSLLDQGLAVISSLNFNDLLKVLFPNIDSLGVRASDKNFEQTQISP